jgi:two-component system response regulator YesN
MGKTFSQFLIEIKVHKAKELLDAGMKAGDVMERIGLNNYSYFYRSFKRFYGVSPEAFKRKTKKEKDK